jgi:hypothetical protein
MTTDNPWRTKKKKNNKYLAKAEDVPIIYE